jgi:hypothetical protein
MDRGLWSRILSHSKSNPLSPERAGYWAVAFDGSNSYIDCGTNVSLDNLFYIAKTIDFWAYLPSLDPEAEETAYLLAKQYLNNGWAVRAVYNNEFTFAISAPLGAAAASVLYTPGRWSHYAVYYDQYNTGLPYIAVDGVWGPYNYQIAKTGNLISDSVGRFYMGAITPPLQQVLNGRIGWVRISYQARFAVGDTFTPPARGTPPDIDSMTLEQWDMNVGHGTAILARVGTPYTDGVGSSISWIFS